MSSAGPSLGRRRRSDRLPREGNQRERRDGKTTVHQPEHLAGRVVVGFGDERREDQPQDDDGNGVPVDQRRVRRHREEAAPARGTNGPSTRATRRPPLRPPRRRRADEAEACRQRGDSHRLGARASFEDLSRRAQPRLMPRPELRPGGSWGRDVPFGHEPLRVRARRPVDSLRVADCRRRTAPVRGLVSCKGSGE